MFDSAPKMWHDLDARGRREKLGIVAPPEDTVIDCESEEVLVDSAPLPLSLCRGRHRCRRRRRGCCSICCCCCCFFVVAAVVVAVVVVVVIVVFVAVVFIVVVNVLSARVVLVVCADT